MGHTPERHTWTFSPSHHRTRAGIKNILQTGFGSVEDQTPSSSLVPFKLISCKFFQLAWKFSNLDPTIQSTDSVFPHESPAELEPVWDRVWRWTLSGRAVSILKEILTSQSGQTKAARLDGDVQASAWDEIKGRRTKKHKMLKKKIQESSL